MPGRICGLHSCSRGTPCLRQEQPVGYCGNHALLACLLVTDLICAELLDSCFPLAFRIDWRSRIDTVNRGAGNEYRHFCRKGCISPWIACNFHTQFGAWGYLRRRTDCHWTLRALVPRLGRSWETRKKLVISKVSRGYHQILSTSPGDILI